jgi:hypothetical protein
MPIRGFAAVASKPTLGNHSGESPLVYAAITGNAAIIDLLLAGAPISPSVMILGGRQAPFCITEYRRCRRLDWANSTAASVVLPQQRPACCWRENVDQIRSLATFTWEISSATLRHVIVKSVLSLLPGRFASLFASALTLGEH